MPRVAVVVVLVSLGLGWRSPAVHAEPPPGAQPAPAFGNSGLPKSPEAALMRRAQKEMGQGNHAMAAELFDQAAALEPTNAEACYLGGLAWMHVDKPEEAQKRAEQALQRRPGFEKAQILLGMALKTQKKYSEAEKAFSEAAKTVGEDPSLFEHMGHNALLQKKYPEAIDRFGKAYAHLKEKDTARKASIQYNIALCYFYMGHHGNALMHIDEAIALAPGNEKYIKQRGEIEVWKARAEREEPAPLQIDFPGGKGFEE